MLFALTKTVKAANANARPEIRIFISYVRLPISLRASQSNKGARCEQWIPRN